MYTFEKNNSLSQEESFELKKKIERTILLNQLEFVKYMSESSTEPMSELIKKYSTIIQKFDDFAINRVPEEEKEQLLEYIDGLSLTTPNEEYLTLINEKMNSIINDVGGERVIIKKNKRKNVFDYNKRIANDCDAEDLNLNVGDDYLEIHVPIQAVDGQGEVGITESLRQIATFIKNEYPFVKAVIGKSWIISTAVAKRMGFEVVKTFEPNNKEGKINPFNMVGYWGQLVNEQGEIKTKIKKYLFENKKLRYDYAYGKIDIVSFFEKYLPPEERGRIVLKERSAEASMIVLALDSEEIKLEEIMTKQTNGDFESEVRKIIPVHLEILGDDGDAFIRALKSAKEKNVWIREFYTEEYHDVGMEIIKSLDKVLEYRKSFVVNEKSIDIV